MYYYCLKLCISDDENASTVTNYILVEIMIAYDAVVISGLLFRCF